MSIVHYARFFLSDCARPRLGRLLDQNHLELLEERLLSSPLPTGEVISIDAITRWLPPCCPSKIIAVGLNYRDHALQDMKVPLPKEPLLFSKAVTSLLAHNEAIQRPAETNRLDYEAELGIVIGCRACGVNESEALSYVAGYTCVNDVTARDLQSQDGQYDRSKSFDTFCPTGPFLTVGADPSDLAIESRLNGKVMQQSRTSQLIFPVPVQVSYISRMMTLMPGDLILTGTPAGVAPMTKGDQIEVEIEGLGCLRNTVIDR